MTNTEVLLAARCKKVYANAHTYHINSISVNSDQETFLSADDLRINLWNLGITEQSFNIVDIKPTNMEDLTEVSDQCFAAWLGAAWLGAGYCLHSPSIIGAQMVVPCFISHSDRCLTFS